MNHMPSAPFVPGAERPAYQAVDFIETNEDTIWHNPLDYDVAVQVHVGAEGKAADTPVERQRWASLPANVRREKQTGIRTYVIPSKTSRAIPSEFDMAIQHTQCAHPECAGAKGLYCKDATHSDYKKIVGGLYPRLVNKGTQRTPLAKPPALHWALDDQRAKAAEALEASKRKLAEAANARDAFLIAQADLATAQEEIAKAEKNLADQVPNEGTIHKEIIARENGEPAVASDASKRAAIANKVK
jgi:hypothetical protein